MAWIELHQELRSHPKIKRLATKLAIIPATATGALINLWLWAVQYAQNGEITKFTDAEIGYACELPEQHHPGLIKTLSDCGWIDDRNGKKIIHDWKKHGLKYLNSVNDRVRKHREKKRLEEEEQSFSNVTVTATIPNLTVPNPTLPEIYEKILESWNNFANSVGLTTIIKLSDKRKSAIKTRVREKEFDLSKIYSEIQNSNFLKGEKGWKVDFDFVFCSANNYLKIIEGKYRNKNGQQQKPTRHQFDSSKYPTLSQTQDTKPGSI